MAETITIAANAVVAKLHNPSREAALAVQQILSYKVAGSEMSSAFKAGSWDGRSSFFNFRQSSFPAGFLHYLCAKLRAQGYETRIARKPLPEPLGPKNPKIDEFPEDPRYDYQPDVVERLVKYGQIIAQVATGGGKSRIARLAFARINRPTLFLTTRGILMYQMKETFENDLGVPCSVLGDGQFGTTTAGGQLTVKKMSVGMVQTLVSRLKAKSAEEEFIALVEQHKAKQAEQVDQLRAMLKAHKASPKVTQDKLAALAKTQLDDLKARKKLFVAEAEAKAAEQARVRQQTINLLKMFEFVILEEAHEASGNSYYEILQHCTNAHYRLALTATPFMKDDEESNMRLMACSGPIAIKVTEKMLIDRGILATPKFKIVRLAKKPPKLLRGTGWQAAYRIGIVDNDERNDAVVREVLRAKTYGLTSMVLIQQKRHGEVMRDKLEAAGVRSLFIQGESDQAERKRALRKLATGEIDALIGTTILDVGVDVPAVGLIALAGGGKAEVAMRQRIGRGLRAKKKGPNMAMIVDFDDPWNMHTKSHAQERASIISDTPGFAENVVLGDFNYEACGFSRQ